jgi:hypothetical protein
MIMLLYHVLSVKSTIVLDRELYVAHIDSSTAFAGLLSDDEEMGETLCTLARNHVCACVMPLFQSACTRSLGCVYLTTVGR